MFLLVKTYKKVSSKGISLGNSSLFFLFYYYFSGFGTLTIFLEELQAKSIIYSPNISTIYSDKFIKFLVLELGKYKGFKASTINLLSLFSNKTYSIFSIDPSTIHSLFKVQIYPVLAGL